MKVLGADIGFGYTKATDGRQSQVFKSIVGEATEVQFGESLLPGAATHPRHFIIGNDSYFIDAITILRDGAEPREPKVGSYNLAGLSDVTVLENNFEVHPLFDRMDAKYRGNTLFMIDAD